MTSFIVTTLNDELDAADKDPATANPADLSLREALWLALANGAGTADTIAFDPDLAGGTLGIRFERGHLPIQGNVTIDGDVNGDDEADITISGGGGGRVFNITHATATLDALIIYGGNTRAGEGGGIFIAAGADLTLVNSVVRHSYASDGGGIANRGTLSVRNSWIDDNVANHIYSSRGRGGGLINFGTATLVDTRVSGNYAARHGGGIANFGTATLINTSLDDNFARINGGGIYASQSVLSLTNVTLHGNWAYDGPGGGLHLIGAAELTNTTVSGNRSTEGPGGIYQPIDSAGSLRLTNSIVAGNRSDPAGVPELTHNAFAVFGGLNIFADPNTGDAQDIDGANVADIFHATALVPYSAVRGGVLADNGGPVPTIALKVGGLAHNAGDTGVLALHQDTADLDHDGNVTEPLPVDARGLPRVIGPSVDVGAFELDGIAPVRDVLWRHDDGRVATVLGPVDTAPAASLIAATGDFDADGDADIVWRDGQGTPAIWELESGDLQATHGLSQVSRNYQIAGTGDLDGDGDADILWRHAQGQTVVWHMQDNALASSRSPGVVSNSWQLEGTGDFDHDGDADILWQHQQTRAVVIWEMEDGAYVRNRNVATSSGSWRIDATGDFDEDGDADILWFHPESGALLTWEMQSGALVRTHRLPNASPAWQVAGAHDFDSDGDSDILLRHQNGLVVTWEMQGGEFRQARNFGTVTNAWQIAGTGEFDLA